MRVLFDFEMSMISGGTSPAIDTIVVVGQKNTSSSSGTSTWSIEVTFMPEFSNIDADAASVEPPESTVIDIQVKDGVDLSTLSPQALAALYTAQTVATANGYNLVVTSTTDGVHSSGSLHYSGLAFDIRGNDVSDAVMQSFSDALQAALGNDYDVVPEYYASNPANDHIHVEYDPA